MTTNGSVKLNRGGVSAIKDIITVPAEQRSDNQQKYLDACLTALAHQPERWYSYQDWGPGGPVHYLAGAGIKFRPSPDANPIASSWYDGCDCADPHY